MRTLEKSTYKVSVLIPVYGVEKYIEKCAISLFSQTFQEVEFVFVNDCSKDNSIEILKNTLLKFPERKAATKIIQHEINQGLSGARKTGIENASGEYLLCVDSDDYIELDAIELLYNKAIETKADIIICPMINEYANGKAIVYDNIIFNSKIEYINSSFSQPSLCNKLVRKKLYEHEDVQFIPGINYGEDLSISPKLFYYANNFATVKKPLYHYIQYNTNSYTNEFTDKNLEQTLKVIELLNHFFSTKIDYLKYKNSILQLKAIRKAKILRSGRVDKVQIELFPEINYGFLNFKLDSKTKIILFLAAFRQKKLLRVFVNQLIARGKKLRES